MVGVDASSDGVRIANERWPGLDVFQRSLYDDLAAAYGRFDAATCIEVIEHLFDPPAFLARVRELLAPNGTLILSTPYHGYLKNLAIALAGKTDHHFTANWVGGHIKFWSVATLSQALDEAGFDVVAVRRVGRIPPLAKSMVVRAQVR